MCVTTVTNGMCASLAHSRCVLLQAELEAHSVGVRLGTVNRDRRREMLLDGAWPPLVIRRRPARKGV